MNNPQFAFPAGAAVAPPPPAPFPGAAPAAPAPVPVDWYSKAMSLIEAKVTVHNSPIGRMMRPEQGYALVCRQIGMAPNAPGVDQRICGALEGLKTPLDIAPPMTLEEVQAEVLPLVAKKITYLGQPVAQDPPSLGQVATWLLANFPEAGITDPLAKMTALHRWLTAIPGYEADAATRAAKTATAPANPVSTQTAPQVAQLAPAPTPPAPLAGEPEETGPDGKFIDPSDGASYKTLRGLKTRVTKSGKGPWPDFCKVHNLDPESGRPASGAPPVAPPQAGIPTTPPPAAAALPMLVGQQPAVPTFDTMPTPPVTHESAPVPTFLATPPAAPPAAYVPQLTQAPPPVAYVPPAAPAAPVAAQPLAPPSQVPLGLDRAAAARQLGGEVTLVVVRLLEANTAPIQGRMDANQLAMLAQESAKKEQRIIDLAQAAYGAGKQAAQRHFATLLTQNPHCFLLMNGYDAILPDEFMDILIARTTSLLHITDQGRSQVEIRF